MLKMSRSYKKHPYCGEKKHMKDYANRVVRNHLKHDKDLANGNAYKKLYEDYPEYNKPETVFMVNATKVEKNKTLKENNIKNNSIISVFGGD